jgi:hypothetical protein
MSSLVLVGALTSLLRDALEADGAESLADQRLRVDLLHLTEQVDVEIEATAARRHLHIAPDA